VKYTKSAGAWHLSIVVRNWRPCALSLDQAAELVGVDTSAFCRWLCGRSVPDAENILKIAEVYGVEPRQWLKPVR